MMAGNQLNNVGGDNIFVYTGGEQEVPRDVKRVRIAENVDTIPEGTFQGRQELIEVEGHKNLKKIEQFAFSTCRRLRRVSKMTGVVEIGFCAFSGCYSLGEMEFDKLEIIGDAAFVACKSLRSISMPSVRIVGSGTFMFCDELTDAVFGKDLETIKEFAFHACAALRSITIPLKDNLIFDEYTFTVCDNFSRVDILVGGIHKPITSLHMETWRNEMEEEIDRINQTLPNTRAIEKGEAIQQWITRVLGKLEHFKSEHKVLVKEAMTLLELALWKTKLLNKADEKMINTEAARKENRVTCGASIVIKNVLPFLALK
jgi:hypothetical protein